MKIFLSWSGQRSKLVAELLKFWLQHVIQAIDPWISNKDIDRGSIWFSEINNQLSTTNNGIVCLTKSNINNPWILFESGALAKGLSHNRVFTFLIDLVPNEVNDPLAQFNHTLPTKEDLHQLVQSLNKGLEKNAVSENILSGVFEKFYNDFEIKFKKIIEMTSEIESKIKMDESDFISEILYTVRTIDKRIRKLEEAEDENPRRSTISMKYLRTQDPLTTSIAELDLSVRAYNTLKVNRVDTIHELFNFDLQKIENEKIRAEILEFVEDWKFIYG